MIKRRISIPILYLLACTLALLTLSACNQEKRLMEHFPEWYELPVELSEISIEPSVEMEFQGINFGAYTSPEGDTYDEVLVHLANTGDQSIYKYEDFGILYLYNDKWYSVYFLPAKSLLAIVGNNYAAHSEEDISFLVPSGLFDIPGQYKLWNRSIGLCDIDIVFVPE